MGGGGTGGLGPFLAGGPKGLLRSGEALVPIRIFNFFWILLQGKGEKVWGMVFFGGEEGFGAG
jgi:hypothetical protein